MTRTIINTYDQLRAARNSVAICKHFGGARDRYVAGWGITHFVNGAAVPTNPNAAWYDDGHKVFLNGRHKGTFYQRQAIALEEAKAWVTEQGWYTGEWKRNAMGDFVPAEVQKQFPIQKRKKGE